MTSRFLVYDVANNRQEEVGALEDALALRKALVEAMVTRYREDMTRTHGITAVNISEDGYEVWVKVYE